MKGIVTLTALAGNKEPVLPTLALTLAAAQDMRCFVLVFFLILYLFRVVCMPQP